MPPSASFGFTKLVVQDLETMAAFYRDVFGLHPVNPVRGEKIGAEAIEEIFLSPDPTATWSSLVLLRYLDRGPSPIGESILGFTTDDLPALLERLCNAGGRITAPIREIQRLKIRVAFATDPEGHLAELVQVLA